MENEGHLIAERETGHRAARVLDNDAFLLAVEKIKDRIWLKFPGCEPDQLERLQLELLSLNNIIKELRTMVDTGKMADQQLRNEVH